MIENQLAESNRRAAEYNQQLTEISRQKNESDRRAAEYNQQLAEISRQKNESDRRAAESEQNMQNILNFLLENGYSLDDVTAKINISEQQDILKTLSPQ